MPKTASWNVLSDSDSNRVILSVDFPVAGRVEAGFADLVKNLGAEWSGYRILHTVPPTIAPADQPRGTEFVEQWVRELRAVPGVEVAAVLGFCAGSVYAAALADAVAAGQDAAPALLLFDPQFADIELLFTEMHKMVAVFGDLLPAEEIDKAGARIAQIVEARHEEIVTVAAELVSLFREVGSVALGGLGLNEERKEEVFQLFESYMSWLATTVQIDPAETWNRATAFVSTDYANAAAPDSSIGRASALMGRGIPLETTHIDLLRSDCAARRLLEDGGLR
jgi:hypothetical protein